MINRSQSAIRFLELMSVKSGRMASLGSADSFANDNVRRAIGQAHEDMAASVNLIGRLAKDETRTAPDMNYRAKREAEALAPRLAGARDTLRTEANKIENNALARVNDKLALDPSNIVFQQLKLNWLKEQYADPVNGLVAIDKAIKSDIELAGLMNSGVGYILGMSEDARLSFVAKAVNAHLPDAAAELKTAERVRDTADKYDGIIGSVHSSFYVAEQAERYEKTRVED